MPGLGTGARNAVHLRDTEGTLADLAVEAWAGGLRPLLFLTVWLAVLGALESVSLVVEFVEDSALEVVLVAMAERYAMGGVCGVA